MINFYQATVRVFSYDQKVFRFVVAGTVGVFNLACNSRPVISPERQAAVGEGRLGKTQEQNHEQQLPAANAAVTDDPLPGRAFHLFLLNQNCLDGYQL